MGAASSSGGPTQPDAGRTGPDPKSVLQPEILLGPVDGCTAGTDTDTLLILGPGALCKAEDYVNLAIAVQEMLKDKVRLTVALLNINWAGLRFDDTGNPLGNATSEGIKQAIQNAQQYVNVPQAASAMRKDNVFLGGHSLMGPYMLEHALKQAGGLLLLASQALPSVSTTFPCFSTWTRPVLNVTGELDGQMLISQQAAAAVDAADNASRLSLHHVAAFQPVVFIPGVNHMQIGPGVEQCNPASSEPVDLEADISHEGATQRVATVMADFLAVHRASPALQKEATHRMVDRVVASAELIGPLVQASGRGDIAKLVRELAQDPHLPQPHLSARAGLTPRAVGGEVFPASLNDAGKWLAHPGELAAAEAAVVRAQQRVLACLPQALQDRVVIAATTHTDETPFLYNQPTIQRLPDGRVLLRPHVYLWRHFLETKQRVQAAVHPEYAMKLRTAGAVAGALGEQEELEKHRESTVSPTHLNNEILEDALKVLPEAARERYQKRGKKWHCSSRTDFSPPQWVQDEHVTFTDDGDITQINAPIVQTMLPPQPVADYDRGMGRFVGNLYFKVLSPARAMEWLMIDALRPTQLQPRPGGV